MYDFEQHEVADECIRVIGHVPIRVFDAKECPERIERARDLCDRYGMGVTLSYAPYMYATPPNTLPSDVGPKEMQLQWEMIELFRSLWPDCPVKMILLDSERFNRVGDYDTRQLVALRERYDESASQFLAAYPKAEMNYYDNGMVHVQGRDVDALWTFPSRNFPEGYRIGRNSVELYRVGEFTQRIAIELAFEDSKKKLCAWICLGAGWDWSSGKQVWHSQWDDAAAAAGPLGRRIASQEHPWGLIDLVAIYRSPLQDGIGGAAWNAFVSYMSEAAKPGA